jgi:hypothetical protein
MTVIRSIDVAVRAAVKGSKRFEPKHFTRTLWAAALVLGLSATAQAQQKPADETPAAGGGAASLEEITVTGSRIKRTNDFNTPTPTTVIDTQAMENMGMVNVGETLQLTPANASTFTPANTGNSPYFIGTYIPDLRGLNPRTGTSVRPTGTACSTTSSISSSVARWSTRTPWDVRTCACGARPTRAPTRPANRRSRA